MGRGGLWGGGGRLFEAGRLLTFSASEDGRLFEVSTNSRLGAYSNKYSIFWCVTGFYRSTSTMYIARFPSLNDTAE